MPLLPNFPLQFRYIPYPLWRKAVFPLLRPAADAMYRRFYPVDLDHVPPTSLEAVAQYLRRWNLIPEAQVSDLDAVQPDFRLSPPGLVSTDARYRIRLPAPWEPMESILLHFPVIYPPLWPMFAEMIEAITPVAEVEITIPVPMWAQAILLYLQRRTKADIGRVRFLDIPADDIWIRDYGPFVGYLPDGQRAVVTATYATHPLYPQSGDDAMPGKYAELHGMPIRDIRLRTEGGNFLTDGAGTLIMSTKVLRANPHLNRYSLEALLHEYFEFEKLILTPYLSIETTGHTDLLVKLIDAQTVLISQPQTLTARGRLQQAIQLFQRETNAVGQRYNVETVPTPTLYTNWFFYPIRRSYTNTLTVNGRILVPVYGLPQDNIALDTYRRVAPDYTIVPVDSAIGVNGGGAVHCMTKEIARPLV
jgi:agmatine deiminase